MSKMILGELY